MAEIHHYWIGQIGPSWGNMGIKAPEISDFPIERSYKIQGGEINIRFCQENSTKGGGYPTTDSVEMCLEEKPC